MAAKLSKVVTFHKKIQPIKSQNSLNSWSREVTWYVKNTTTVLMTTIHDLLITWLSYSYFWKTSGKGSHISETISSDRFSIAQNKSQLKVAKEQLTAALSDTSTRQTFENFQNCNIVDDNINLNAKKKAIYHLKRKTGARTN